MKNLKNCENGFCSINTINNNFKCKKFSEIPLAISNVTRTIGIGDIHGDINLAINFLLVSGVIEEVKINTNDKIVEHIHYLSKNQNDTFSLKYKQKTLPYKHLNDIDINQYNIVYRYYEINNQYFVRVSQQYNNKNKYDKNRWFKWIGNDTHVVQVGDQVDRCRPNGHDNCHVLGTTENDEDSDLEIMLFYDSVDKIATLTSKGRVFSLLGNHELMNVDGDMRYVSYEGIKNFGSKEKRTEIFKTIIARKMACTRPALIIINDYLFVHAGIAEKLSFDYKLININDALHKYLSNLKYLENNEKLLNLLKSNDYSPFWYRKLAYITPDKMLDDNIDLNSPKSKDCSVLLDPVLKQLNNNNDEFLTMELNGLIIGHTPTFSALNSGISSACHGGVVRVDIGASMAFDKFDDNTGLRNTQVIEIINMNGKSKMRIIK